MAGYHNNFILKNQHGSFLKLKEEVDEFIDSISSENVIMAHQELSDVYLALRQITTELGLSMDDLERMADTTERVFRNGGRSGQSIFDMIVQNTAYHMYTNTKNTFNQLITPDMNYRYVLLGDVDDMTYHVANIEYFEVIKGSVTYFESRYESGNICQPNIKDDQYINFDKNTVILVKTIHIPPNINMLSSFNGDPKSIPQFELLREILDV